MGIIPFMLQIAGPLDLEVVLVRVVQPITPKAVEGMRHFTVENVPERMNEARQYLAPIAARTTPRCARGGRG